MSPVCTYHCAACGAHFTSLEAFDLHRDGDHAVKRYCLDPDEVPRLAVATTEGFCRLAKPGQELPDVVLYRSRRHADDHERAVLRLRVGERAAERPPGDLDLGRAA